MYRITELTRSGRELFHTGDLAVIWGVENKNTLYTAIKRLVSKGELVPVHKGLYSLLPLNKIDPIKLGLAVIHSYAYVSCESVLTREGVIDQVVQAITLVGSVSRRFSLAGHEYICRKLNPKFLHSSAGMETQNGVSWASAFRAVADLLYFNPQYYFDNREKIDWSEVRQIQQEVGYV
ncbi:MAG: hypothetical protein UX93_C0004G0016 [Microgenomates group bacterium GW2011_GWC1_47_20]|uniref:Transcriptional regulator n=1 Tax=Candidatus Amesbacteria bacterium GW2011_GWC2_45_19 TaxID=1618366 RepID=A0A0G1M4X3_9BACT|nr:MAG: hypothetical protein UX05_C0002G0072 [Candidatus Amesbacteria bacterium GW2011_GWC2_45_19]KKU68945.1 MAG: hypothetical protein UX93_C0004G0016 [Microgenomates group bacterium GW2011_GWC1_47_20]